MLTSTPAGQRRRAVGVAEVRCAVQRRIGIELRPTGSSAACSGAFFSRLSCRAGWASCCLTPCGRGRNGSCSARH
jgi:hypothetical protein